MSNVPVTGITSNTIVPGFFAEVEFAQGPSTATGGDRETFYFTPMTSEGTGTANTVYAVKNEQEVIELVGSGAPGHLMTRRHFRVNKRGDVFVVPYLESSGGAVSADGYIKFVGTATSSGVVNVFLNGEQLSVPVSVGDTADALGEKLEAAANSKTWLPASCANTSGVARFTAKIAGASQGDGTNNVISLHFVKSKAAGITVTKTGNYLGQGFGAVAGADGSTSELTNFQAALDAVTAVKSYYIVPSLSSSAALAAVANHVAQKSEPNPGLRCVSIAGAATNTLAETQTLAVGLNFARTILAWQNKPVDAPYVIAANVAAIVVKYTATDVAKNFDGFKGTDWLVPNSYSTSDYLDFDDVNDAMIDGITVINSSSVGTSIVSLLTTRSKDASGLLDDRRILEAHRVSTVDAIVATHQARHAAIYSGSKLKDDEKLPNGDVNPNQTRLPGVTTPSNYKAWLGSLIREYERDGKLKNVDNTIAGIYCEVDNTVSGRLEVSYDLDVIDLLHQVTVRVAEVSSG